MMWCHGRPIQMFGCGVLPEQPQTRQPQQHWTAAGPTTMRDSLLGVGVAAAFGAWELEPGLPNVAPQRNARTRLPLRSGICRKADG
jgi:hypothetical protein